MKKSKNVKFKHQNFIRSWNKDEDKLLIEFYQQMPDIWADISKKFQLLGKSKSGKQCRERWVNYVNPKINHKKFSKKELDKIFKMVRKHNTNWVEIAKKFKNRSENAIKNTFYSIVKRSTKFIEKKYLEIGLKKDSVSLKDLKRISYDLDIPIHKLEYAPKLEIYNSLKRLNPVRKRNKRKHKDILDHILRRSVRLKSIEVPPIINQTIQQNLNIDPDKHDENKITPQRKKQRQSLVDKLEIKKDIEEIEKLQPSSSDALKRFVFHEDNLIRKENMNSFIHKIENNQQPIRLPSIIGIPFINNIEDKKLFQFPFNPQEDLHFNLFQSFNFKYLNEQILKTFLLKFNNLMK